VRGKARTPKVTDLAFIFFKLRTSRDSSDRRSWQRRARLALAQRLDLSPAERHEIACVWSQPGVGLIDSPALRKLHARSNGPAEYETTPARQFTRARFDVTTKKPGVTRLDVGRVEAVNDSQWLTCARIRDRHRR
jgi:hypothetical protein